MSDSEDTDDLLLIPPDFFTVHSEPDPPYYNIVDSLIKQVINLQDRIEGIEHMSDVSLSSYCNVPLDSENRLIMANKTSNKKYYSYDDLFHQTSTETTPQKANRQLHLSSLPNSPNIKALKPSVKFSTPQKHSASGGNSKIVLKDDTEVLSDIDKFLSNVRIIQRKHPARNLETVFNDVEMSAKEASIYRGEVSRKLKFVGHEDGISEDMDKQSKKICAERSKFESKNDIREKPDGIQKVTNWQCGDNVESVPNLSAGARDIMYKSQKAVDDTAKSINLKPMNQPTSTVDFTSTSTSLEKSTDSSSESTQLTAYTQCITKQESVTSFDQGANTLSDNRTTGRGLANIKQRTELLETPLHDSALNALDMHRKLLSVSNAATHDDKCHKKRGINTLTDNMGLLNLADMWGVGRVSQSQTVQEERLRRQHCEQLIRELQARNLEMQQKLAVAVQVDQMKNETIDQFKDVLETASSKIEKLIEEKQLWELEVANMKHQFSVQTDLSDKKISFYENENAKSANLIRNTNEKIAELESRCADLQTQLHHIDTKFQEVQSDYKREYEKNQQLADIISQKEIELKENKTVLSNAREEVSHSRKAVEVCQAELTSLKNECALLQSEAREDKNVISNLGEQKKQLSNELQIYKANEKSLRDALEQSRHKLENTKVELRNFYQGQLEIIVENKRKEMQTQLDQERQNNVEEMRRKELSMAKTAANHIKEISEKCALETKLLEQKYQEEVRLYQMQLSQKSKEIEHLRGKLALLPEKRAEIAKHLQKVMESQWNEALKMIGDRSSPNDVEQNVGATNSKQITTGMLNYDEHPKKEGNVEQNQTEYDETPVSSRGVKQNETAIQKYIDMLLNRPPGNPAMELPDSKLPTNQPRSTWNVPVRSRKPK